MLLHNILVGISFTSELLPIYFALRYFRVLTPVLKLLLVFCIITFIFEIIGMDLGLAGGETETIDKIYSFLQASFIFAMFFMYFEKLMLKRIILIFFVISVLVSFISYHTHLFTSLEIDVPGMTYGLLIIILTNIYYFNVFQDLSVPRLTDSPFFWVNTGLFLYFSTTLFLFIFEKHILGLTLNAFAFMWMINLISNILFNVLISIGICRVNRI